MQEDKRRHDAVHDAEAEGLKHQTLTLVKFDTFRRRLKLPRCYAIGVLESLWLFAQTNARDGYLSRYTNEEIAAWLEWPGDDEELIQALVDLRWLDIYDPKDGQGRGLRIHDWEKHCPNWLKGVQARQPSAAPGAALGAQPPNPTLPNPPHPSPTLPLGSRPIGAAGEIDKIEITDEEYKEATPQMNELRDQLIGHGARMTDRDKELLWKSVCLCHYQLECPDLIRDATRSVREARPKKPVAYFKAILARKLQSMGMDLNTELELVSREGKP